MDMAREPIFSCLNSLQFSNKQDLLRFGEFELKSPVSGCSTICNQGLAKPFNDEHESYNKRLQPQPLQHHHQLPCYSRTNSILGSYSTPCSCAQKDSFSFKCDSCTIANRSDLYCTKLKEVENCHERIFEQESITNEETNDHKSPNNDLVCQGNSISGRESLISLSPINDLSPMGALDSLSSPRPTQALGLVDSKPESQSFSSSDNTETVFSNSITFQQGENCYDDTSKLSKVKNVFDHLSVMTSPARVISSRKYGRIEGASQDQEQEQESVLFCSPFRRRRAKRSNIDVISPADPPGLPEETLASPRDPLIPSRDPLIPSRDPLLPSGDPPSRPPAMKAGNEPPLPPEEFRKLYLERLEMEGNYFKYDDSEDEEICTCPNCLESYESLYKDYLNKCENHLSNNKYCNIM